MSVCASPESFEVTVAYNSLWERTDSLTENGYVDFCADSSIVSHRKWHGFGWECLEHESNFIMARWENFQVILWNNRSSIFRYPGKKNLFVDHFSLLFWNHSFPLTTQNCNTHPHPQDIAVWILDSKLMRRAPSFQSLILSPESYDYLLRAF